MDQTPPSSDVPVTMAENDTTKVTIACMKCGEGISVPIEELLEASKSGATAQVAHEVCPRDAKVLPKYRLRIEIYKDHDESSNLLISAGAEVEAHSFKAAVPNIVRGIEEQLSKVIPLAELADQES